MGRIGVLFKVRVGIHGAGQAAEKVLFQRDVGPLKIVIAQGGATGVYLLTLPPALDGGLMACHAVCGHERQRTRQFAKVHLSVAKHQYTAARGMPEVKMPALLFA